ncbi:MAG TPA: O-methyltransferase [Thermoplasmata archaeon]|nr:O-methyltransferase [Thermoplasmata archaeon]
MDDPLWTLVDRYFETSFLPRDPVLEEALRASEAAGLPAWAISPLQGQFLHLLARLQGAHRILEVGTLGGYSAIWLARALPSEGRLISLEIDPRHAEVALANLERAGLTDRVEVRVGPALALLPPLMDEDRFDLVFIDADKPSSPAYFGWAVRLTRPGGLIVVDNVVRGGRVIDAHDRDPNVQGTRRLVDSVAAEPRVKAVTLPTVGRKGYDGFLIALVHSPTLESDRGVVPLRSRRSPPKSGQAGSGRSVSPASRRR